MERRLTTILAADIAGFSRLIGLDEEGTLEAQRSHHKEFIDPLLEKHGGRVANTAGDSLLVEYPSAVEAVRCALALQTGLAERNAEIPRDRRIEYRIGINVGDVVNQSGDLLGDGVNVAARLEALAPPGGIIVSRSVRDQVRDRLELDMSDLGEISVKNITRAVRAFQVLKEGDTAMKSPGKSTYRLRRLVSIASLVLLVSGAVIVWQSGGFRNASDEQSVLSDKPSIAVLPFDNFTPDESQRYFADGMTEDIITDLSKVSGLFVIARNSSFAYRGKSVDIRTVGQELGVSHVLEGSVRRVGDQLRVNVQLIEVATGGHLWADRIDGETADVFKLQDQMTQHIVNALKVRMTSAEQRRRENGTRVDPQAYDLYLQARKLHSTFKLTDRPEMLRLYGHAIKLDPGFAQAHAHLANVAFDVARLDHFWIMPQQEAYALVERHTAKALELEPDNAMALSTLADQALRAGEAEKAIAMIDQAVTAAPSDIDTVGRQAYILSRSGHHSDAVATVELLLRLEPNPTAVQLAVISHSYFHAKRYEEAIKYGELALTMEVNPSWALEILAPAYARLDRQENLALTMKALFKVWPEISLRHYRYYLHYVRPASNLEHLLESLRLAGVPENPLGVVAMPENMLTEAELADVMHPDVQRIGFDNNGWRFRTVNSADGDYHSTWQSPNGHQFEFTGEGTRLILDEDQQLVLEACSIDPEHNGGREYCALFLRNPGGSKASRDEYLSVTERNVSRFAVFPREADIDWTRAPR
ncbi:adenylate/guanylate cyclase domain-containing protein [Granulosicoccus sp. 3-233]|uniref:adenylate/guanylate cyclase domain-containing protein n=1 Tax=Granulosicoccus sp. 3-233 TaxID=3417969 RepID=UPI003D331883